MSQSFTNLPDLLLEELPVPPQRLTEEEYVRWALASEFKAEWIAGDVISTINLSAAHAELRAWLNCLLYGFCEATRTGIVISDMLLRIDHRPSIRIPEIFFVSSARRQIVGDVIVSEPPDMIVEIVSPQSSARDWREKYWEYERFGVPEYWVIDSAAETFDVYVLDQDGRYQTLPVIDGVIRSTVIPGFWLRSEWFADEFRPDFLDVLSELGVI